MLTSCSFLIMVLLLTVCLPLTVSAQEDLVPITVENAYQLRELARWPDESYAVAFSPDNTKLAFSSGAGDAVLVDILTGDELRKFSGHTDVVSSLAFSPDGTSLVTTSYGDKTVRLWNVQTGEQKVILGSYRSHPAETIYSPDGQVIVSADESVIHIWDAQTGEELRSITGFGEESTNPIGSVQFSPDGTRMIVHNYQDIIVLDSSDETEYLRYAATAASSTVSRVGNILAIHHTSAGTPVELRTLQTGRAVAELDGHSGIVTDEAFSPDVSLIATVSFDETIRLWKTRNGENLQVLTPNYGSLLSVAFSSDGKLLAVAGRQGVGLWGIHNTSEVTQRAGITVKAFRSNGAILETNDYESLIPQQWFANQDIEAKYEIQIIGQGSEIQTCQYGPIGTFKVIRIQQEIVVEITDIETNEQIARNVFQGELPDPCKSEEAFNFTAVNRNYGTPPDPEEVRTWLTETMAEYGFAAD